MGRYVCRHCGDAYHSSKIFTMSSPTGTTFWVCKACVTATGIGRRRHSPSRPMRRRVRDLITRFSIEENSALYWVIQEAIMRLSRKDRKALLET